MSQEEVIRDFSADDVERFIKDVMNTDKIKKKDVGQGWIQYLTPDGHFDIYFQGGRNRNLAFRYPYGPGRKPL